MRSYAEAIEYLADMRQYMDRLHEGDQEGEARFRGAFDAVVFISGRTREEVKQDIDAAFILDELGK